jgi:hypothetical protein
MESARFAVFVAQDRTIPKLMPDRISFFAQVPVSLLLLRVVRYQAHPNLRYILASQTTPLRGTGWPDYIFRPAETVVLFLSNLLSRSYPHNVE